MKPWLHEMKWPEVQEHLRQDDVVLLPIGSVEQHGTHLPLGTDSLVAIGVCKEAARRSDVIIASPLWYGWCPHHMAYPGTVTLRPETMIQLVEDVVTSLIYHGFHHVVVVNGHRTANLPPLQIAAARLRERTGAYVAVADPRWIAARATLAIRESAPGGLGHADEMETGHLYHLRPDLADPALAVRQLGKVGTFAHSIGFDPAFDVDSVILPSTHAELGKRTAPTGVGGDPTLATPEKGKQFHEAVVANLCRLIADARQTPVTVRRPEIPV
ncbi:MAG: creatininase family protein [Chloroflexi bacterium]|nr:creatininase family protein [Chloroflexota bacterium]